MTWAAEPEKRTLVGYSRSMDTIAVALWEHQPPTAQEKTFPGYPPWGKGQGKGQRGKGRGKGGREGE
ncbi:hypothetical protein SAMN06295924_10258 [Rathayibacter rathayi NCPPB 2980 = VKM Ac-1601]|nr:hypothetical protein FB469_1684 [Rathayibacter rathayi]SOE03078.1 hypothetical protein SAMN06295924_10258 [Rathayibacter rathayi NCPPB 2980 = VKM Ac-1601]